MRIHTFHLNLFLPFLQLIALLKEMSARMVNPAVETKLTDITAKMKRVLLNHQIFPNPQLILNPLLFLNHLLFLEFLFHQ